MSVSLTQLQEDEKFFAQEVTKLARKHVAPAVMEMDEQERFRPDLLQKFFELGLMGIEIPAEHGGAGGSFFMSILAIEALSQVDPAAGVIVDVQNTLVNNVFRKWGTPSQQQAYYPLLARDTIGCYCLTESRFWL